MKCGHCQAGSLRLVRYQGSLEIVACRDCGVESPLLDCHSCERRLVHRLPDGANGAQRWTCDSCRDLRIRCPHCARGWLAQTPGGTWHCAACQQQWAQEQEIPAPRNR